jgi:hypothetical protein
MNRKGVRIGPEPLFVFARIMQAVERWVAEDWPRIKKTPAGEKPGSAFKTRAGSASSPP